MNTGDTAWVLTASALVLLMTPGLAFFYGGLVRKKNVVSTIMYSFVSIGLVGVVWVLWGYSLAFGPDLEGWGLIGNLDWFGLKDVSADAPGPYSDAIPHQAFMVFQGMFAIITPALVTGASLCAEHSGRGGQPSHVDPSQLPASLRDSSGAGNFSGGVERGPSAV